MAKAESMRMAKSRFLILRASASSSGRRDGQWRIQRSRRRGSVLQLAQRGIWTAETVEVQAGSIWAWAFGLQGRLI